MLTCGMQPRSTITQFRRSSQQESETASVHGRNSIRREMPNEEKPKRMQRKWASIYHSRMPRIDGQLLEFRVGRRGQAGWIMEDYAYTIERWDVIGDIGAIMRRFEMSFGAFHTTGSPPPSLEAVHHWIANGGMSHATSESENRALIRRENGAF